VRAKTTPLARRLARVDWDAVEARLRDRGHASIGPLLGAAECRRLIRLYDSPERFRSHVQMERHRFGAGDYRYFAEPLPEPVAALRGALYAALAPARSRRAKRSLPPGAKVCCSRTRRGLPGAGADTTGWRSVTASAGCAAATATPWV
jgi:hypothetical protein